MYENGSITDKCKIVDLSSFEGNAMGFRLLTTHDQLSLNLTCATLAAFSKYPRQSFIDGDVQGTRWSDRISQKKYGFFQSELDEFKIVAKEVGLKELKDPLNGNFAWARHPLAFLMEAADDICYSIIDLEDGFRIERISFTDAESPLKLIAGKNSRFDTEYYSSLEEKHKFSYIRALAIDQLIQETFKVFMANYEGIISFSFDKDLIKSIADQDIIEALNNIKQIVRKRIYKWANVLSVEAAGFEVLGELLSNYIEASNICLSCPPETRSKRADKIYDLLPKEFRHDDSEELYLRYLKIASYVSGMTDTFAFSVFQKIKGISKI